MQVVIGHRDPAIRQDCYADELNWAPTVWQRVVYGGHWLPFSHPELLATAAMELSDHLGHFALTGLLLDRLRDRVVTLSSIAHRQTPKLWIDSLNYETRWYQRNLAYAQSKLANLMFARELQRRLAEAGASRLSFAVHPGVSGTDLFTKSETVIDRVAKQWAALVGHPPHLAVHSTLFAATMPDADPTVYWGPTRLMQARGPVRPSPSSRLSHDHKLWRRLWAESERMTGVTYRI